MNKLIRHGVLALLLTGPSLAWAGHNHARDYQDTARVISATPFYRTVRVTEPSEQCWQESSRGRTRAPNWLDEPTGGAVLGAVIGGVVGHQFGGGHGRDVATAGGALLGAGLGQRAEYQTAPHRSPGAGDVTRCRTVHHTYHEQRIAGYDVSYRYHGRVYHTRTDEHPGDRIPVHISVSPLRN